MNKTLITLLALTTGAVATAAEPSSTTPLAVSADATFVSTYVFRGLEAAGASLQPSIEANYRDFYAGVWHSTELDGDTNAETDFYAGYNFALTEIFSADVGLTRYLYEGGGSDLDSTEAYVGVKGNVALSPSVYSYYDFDNQSTTVIGSIGYAVPVAQLGIQIDLSALLGYVQRTNGSSDYGYWGAGASIPYQLSESAKLTAAVNYTHVDDATPTGGISTEQDQVVYSVGIAIGF